jgi:hypothetical protein
MADNGEDSVGIEMIQVRGTGVSAKAGEPPAADIEAGYSVVS